LNTKRHMETPAKVSQEVIDAAVLWAGEHTFYHEAYVAAVDAFIAGSAYMKPIEHEKLPDNGSANN